MNETEEKSDDSSDDPYQSHGYFEPFRARRILKRFEEQGIRFQVSDASGVERWDSKFPQYQLWSTTSARVHRNDRIEIFIHVADSAKARSILDEI